MNLLNLRGNPIGNEGAKALAYTIKKIPLQTLNISGCGIEQSGFQDILDALPESQIHTLNLGGNRVGGAPLHFQFPKKLQFLDLAGNRLGVENGIRLTEALKNSAIEHYDVSGNDFSFCNLPKTMKVNNIDSEEIKINHNKKIPLFRRDLSLVVNENVSFEDLVQRGLNIMGKENIFIDRFEKIDEIPFDNLVEGAKHRLRIKENQKNVVMRIVFKSHSKPLEKKELNNFSDKLYNGLNYSA